MLLGVNYLENGQQCLALTRDYEKDKARLMVVLAIRKWE